MGVRFKMSERIKVKIGCVEPIPNKSDEFEKKDGYRVIAWCCWNKHAGWLEDGTLIKNGEETIQIIYDLKTLNSSPSAHNCAKCNGQLKEPYPRLKHCPKCEP